MREELPYACFKEGVKLRQKLEGYFMIFLNVLKDLDHEVYRGLDGADIRTSAIGPNLK